MSTALKFVILTHISSKVGYGHLNRCIVLGKEIKKRGNKISLIVKAKKYIIKDQQILLKDLF